MAASLSDAGYRVTLVGRRADGLADDEWLRGYRLLRCLPRLRPDAASRLPRLPGIAAQTERGGTALQRALREGPGRLLQAARYLWAARRTARAVADALGPADVWQAEGLVMLPVALHLRARLGGRAIYDSVEIHADAGGFARLPRPWRRLLAWRERRWAAAADAVLTVSRAYAEVLAGRFGRAPVIVMNCPPRWRPPIPSPRRFHEVLDLPPETAVVLFHGNVFRSRGIEQLLDAIALVPEAVLVVLGWGPLFEVYRDRARGLPHASCIHFLPGVPPTELLEWVASADVAAMPIPGDTLNLRLTTPNKLFEAIAAGVPVVVSDLPGMRAIVAGTGAGLSCDPADAVDVARSIRAILEAPPEERAAYHRRCLEAAAGTFNWERQAATYLDVLRDLGARG